MYRLTQTLYPADLQTVGVIWVQGVSRLCEGNALINTCLNVPRIQRKYVGKMVQLLILSLEKNVSLGLSLEGNREVR